MIATQPILAARAETPEAIASLGRELARYAASAQDYVLPAKALTMSADARLLTQMPANTVMADMLMSWEVQPAAHDQLAAAAEIPGRYYRKMLESDTPLLAQNVNRYFPDASNRLVRTVDGRVRAVLSDRYFAVDNLQVFVAVLQDAQRLGIEPRALEVTETRFWLELVRPGFTVPITYKRPEEGGPSQHHAFRWQPGKVELITPYARVENSETGHGGLSLSAGAKLLACWNGLTTERAIYKRHVGSQLPVGILGEDTRRAQASAVTLEIRDLVRASFDEAGFAALVNAATEATGIAIDAPQETIQRIGRAYDLSEEEMEAILGQFLMPTREVDPGQTLWGLMNAITFQAHQAPAERRYELEDIGGRVLVEARPKRLL